MTDTRLLWLPDALRWRVLHIWRGYRERQGFASVFRWPDYLRMTLAPVLRRQGGVPRRLHLRGYTHPLYYRDGSSDLEVIKQVFVAREYDCLIGVPDVRFIVDLGANIGCTTFFLLHHYPSAHAVVVEPDPGNMAVCRRNLAPFGNRVTFLQTGVWSSTSPMVVERSGFRDGAEWSFRVRPLRAGESPDFDAVTVEDVLKAATFPRADLLKVDIEEAEVEVFRQGTEAWLPRVGTLAIELHGPHCERVVSEALAGYRYDAVTSGELTVFRHLMTRTEGS